MKFHLFLSLGIASIFLTNTTACKPRVFNSTPFISTAAPDPSHWNNIEYLNRLMVHSVDFFTKYAWDDESGSLASEIRSDGSRASEARHLLALSRMIYGLAHAGDLNPSYLNMAKRSWSFIQKNMIRKDKKGFYFIESVDKEGREIAAGEGGQWINGEAANLKVNIQAYGLTGLIALYSKTRDVELLRQIQNMHSSFVERFKDVSESGGFWDTFDRRTLTAGGGKSYNSTVYVATSYLLEMNQLDASMSKKVLPLILELADIAVRHFPDPATGFIVENFDQNWNPQWRDWQKQGPNTVGVVGHNFQFAWFLMRAAQALLNSTQGDKGRASQYFNVAEDTLNAMLSKPAKGTAPLVGAPVDLVNGGVHDSFQRETGAPQWNTNKAWWQQAEAILALTLWEKLQKASPNFDWARAKKARNMTFDFFEKAFVDQKGGGEYSTATTDGQPVYKIDDTGTFKGHYGKSAYHTVELYRYLKIYTTKDQEPIK